MMNRILVFVLFELNFIRFSWALNCSTNGFVCKGRIIVYYHDKYYPQTINYTLGNINDILEKKYENDILNFYLDSLKKYQLILHVKTNETLIITDIYCTTNDSCAFDEIQQLIMKYKRQLNPMNQLKPLIYSTNSSSELFCYDISLNEIHRCNSSQSICLSYSKDLKYECSHENEVHLHQEFLVSHPKMVQFNLMNEYIRCNRNQCNHIESLTQIEELSRSYVFGMNGCSYRNKQSIYLLSLFVALKVFGRIQK